MIVSWLILLILLGVAAVLGWVATYVIPKQGNAEPPAKIQKILDAAAANPPTPDTSYVAKRYLYEDESFSRSHSLHAEQYVPDLSLEVGYVLRDAIGRTSADGLPHILLELDKYNTQNELVGTAVSLLQRKTDDFTSWEHIYGPQIIPTGALVNMFTLYPDRIITATTSSLQVMIWNGTDLTNYGNSITKPDINSNIAKIHCDSTDPDHVWVLTSAGDLYLLVWLTGTYTLVGSNVANFHQCGVGLVAVTTSHTAVIYEKDESAGTWSEQTTKVLTDRTVHQAFISSDAQLMLVGWERNSQDAVHYHQILLWEDDSWVEFSNIYQHTKSQLVGHTFAKGHAVVFGDDKSLRFSSLHSMSHTRPITKLHGDELGATTYHLTGVTDFYKQYINYYILLCTTNRTIGDPDHPAKLHVYVKAP